MILNWFPWQPGGWSPLQTYTRRRTGPESQGQGPGGLRQSTVQLEPSWVIVPGTSACLMGASNRWGAECRGIVRAVWTHSEGSAMAI